MILAGPGFLGYGAALLWAGAPKAGVTSAFYDIQVQPGNKLVRRKDDVPITATLIGFQAQQVRLFARYQSSTKWEEAVMLPARQRLGLRVSFRGAAGAGGILRRSRRGEIEDLQAGRDGSSRRHAHQDHVSFPVVAGSAGSGGRSQRRSARRGRHGRRSDRDRPTGR